MITLNPQEFQKFLNQVSELSMRMDKLQAMFGEMQQELYKMRNQESKNEQ